MDARLDAIEEDMSELAAQQEDVTKLAQRLSRVENDASKAATDAKDVNEQRRRPGDARRGPRVERRRGGTGGTGATAATRQGDSP